MKNIIKFMLLGVLCITAVSCEKFLDRPSEDSFTTDKYYQNDSQCEEGIYYLYNSPWYDVIRFYIYGSETMAGNVFQTGSAYSTLTVNGSDADLKNMSASLWAVNAQCNTVIKNILNAEGPSQEIKDKCIGEALAWKAMTYFLLVRSFGAVPIIHDNLVLITSAKYNEVQKVQIDDVYEYIVMTLEKAIELLPVNPYIGVYNRIDRYAAEALLAKVYLTRAGVSGSLNDVYLQKAKDLADNVIRNSGRQLTPSYEDVFRLSPKTYQQTGECLFSWLWTSTSGIWTAQNSIQSDVGLVGFDEFADLWGDWKGPTVDLQNAFGVSAKDDPTLRKGEKDVRRKATCMMFGDQYPYYWADKGGFDYYRFFYDKDYSSSSGSFGCGSGANYAKHLYGNNQDHLAALGVNASRMCNQLPTHILRLSDIYLVDAEATLLLQTKDRNSKITGEALMFVNEVRERAGAQALSSVSWNDIWKERRLELSLEGDRWYDYVRVSYYDVNFCIQDLLSQKRSNWDGLDAAYKSYVVGDDNAYAGPGAHSWDGSSITYNPQYELKDVKESMFTLPMPDEDAVLNPNMGTGKEPIHVDVREEYKYDF